MLACIEGSVCWYVFKKLQVYIQGSVCVSKHGRMDASMCTVKEGSVGMYSRNCMWDCKLCGIVCVSKHGRMDASVCTVKEGIVGMYSRDCMCW
jgi:hypothetical protein